MSLTQDDVKQILRLLDESDFKEIDLKIGDLHLIVSKEGAGIAARETAAPPTPASRPAPAAPEQDGPEQQPPQPDEIQDLAAQNGYIPVLAPTLGIFYRAPKPGAPAFVEESGVVQETDTVCIIEVMKLFNHIKAGVSGRVVKVCAENGAMVEHNQVLFLIDPAKG